MARGHATDVTIRHHARLTSKGVVIRFFTLAPLHANRQTPAAHARPRHCAQQTSIHGMIILLPSTIRIGSQAQCTPFPSNTPPLKHLLT